MLSFSVLRWVTSKQKLDRPRADFSLLKIPQKRSRRSSSTRLCAMTYRTSSYSINAMIFVGIWCLCPKHSSPVQVERKEAFKPQADEREQKLTRLD